VQGKLESLAAVMKSTVAIGASTVIPDSGGPPSDVPPEVEVVMVGTFERRLREL
jgi:hypothetical protein